MTQVMIQHQKTKLYFKREVVQKPHAKPTTRTSWVPKDSGTVFPSTDDETFCTVIGHINTSTVNIIMLEDRIVTEEELLENLKKTFETPKPNEGPYEE